MSKEQQNYTIVSIDPDDATSGLMLNDVNVEVLESAFKMFDYQGKQDEAAQLYWKVKDIDTGEEHEQYWSVGGKPGDFFPVLDGRSLGTSTGKGMNKTCKAVMLLNSLRDSGYSKEKSTGTDASIYTGLKCHMIQVPDKDRPGLEKKDDKKRTVAVVDRIIAYPGEKAAGKGAGAGAGDTTTTTTTRKATTAEIEGMALSAVMQTLASTGTPMKKMDLSSAVLKLLAGHPMQQKAMALLFQADWLKSQPGIVVNGNEVSLATE